MSHFKVLVIGGRAAKWDWFRIGGRFRGALLVKAGAVAHLGRPGAFDNEPLHSGGVDQARVKDIDWAEMRARQRKLAEENHAEFAALHAKDPREARIQFWVTDDEATAMLADPERWINTHSAPFTCRAVVKDSEWSEKGSMGWFGVSQGDMSDEQWQQRLSELLANLDGETLLTVVDCHI